MRKTCFRRAFSVFLVLSFLLTQSGGLVPGLGYGEARAAASTSILDERISSAQGLYGNAIEGTAVGNYQTGSKAELLTVIESAKSAKANFPDNQDIIDSAVITLNNAIALFEAKEITASNVDSDGDEFLDTVDNCDLVKNVDQLDADNNGIGDACEDTEAPVITIVGSNPIDVFVGDDYADAGATALDNVDGDITKDIDVANTVNTFVVGTYAVTYNIDDAADNPAIPAVRTVNVIERENDGDEDVVNPVITILGSNPVTIYVGDNYEDAGATASDDREGVGNIARVNTVNTAVAGTYTVTYDVSDAADNEADQKVRTVNVIEKQISGGGGSTFIISKFVPEEASIIINSGNDKTANRNVVLTLKAPNAKMMALSNLATFADSSWEIFKEGVEWTLTEGNGERTVYAKFKNNCGTESAVYTDTITLGANTNGGDDSSGDVLGDNTIGIYDGDLIQCKSSANPNAVYIVKIVGNQRFIRQIKSDFFKYYKHLSWADVLQVGSLDEFVTSRWVRVNTGTSGTAKATDRVYEINGDWTKHWLNMSKEQFYGKGGSEAEIFSINNGELGSYLTGNNVSIS